MKVVRFIWLDAGSTIDRCRVALFGCSLTNEDSISLATRWFDLRYGSSAGLIPPRQTFNGAPAVAKSGPPRGL